MQATSLRTALGASAALLLGLDQHGHSAASAQPVAQLTLPHWRRYVTTQAIAKRAGHERKEPGVTAGLKERLFVSTRRFHHDPLRAHRNQALDQPGDTGPVIGKAHYPRVPIQGQIQVGLAHVDPAARMLVLR